MIHYTDRMVEVYHNHQRIATHLRERISSGYTTKKEHLPSSHQFYLNWSPQFFIDKARPIGPCTVEYIQRLFDQDGPAEPKYKTALGIVQLQKKYDRGRINRACQIALLHPVSSYQRVLGILEKDIDLEYNLFETPPSQGSSHIPDHENIRGAEYFSSLLNQNNNHASDN